MDILFIEQLIVMAFIGVYDWEQQRLQKLVFDLELGYNGLPPISHSNDFMDYLNYVDASEAVISLVSGKHFVLVELVAEQVAEQLITQFNLLWAHVKVSKPGAVSYASNVGVIIERWKRNT